MAVCEACENIVRHGYGEENEGPIRVEIRGEPGEIIVDIKDKAPPFDPAAVTPKPPSTTKDPPVGGFGLYILQQVMDEVSYSREGKQNRLHLLKRAGKTTA